MEVIRKINNNAAICIDSAGREMIAIGTGIGFPKVPYTLDNLDLIQQTYYGIDEIYLDLLNQISNDIFNVSSQIVDCFRNRVNPTVSSNLVFTLADHINFAIERAEKHLMIENPLHYEIQHLYEEAYDIGIYAIKLIKKQLQISLPKAEAGNIALHLINAETVASSVMKSDASLVIIEDIAQIIAEYFKMYINSDSVSYSRFVSHMKYLLKREQKKDQISTDNEKIFLAVKEKYPHTYNCVLKIAKYLEEECSMEINDEELLYLILHVNRLCVREDCYQKGITSEQENE